MTNKELKQQLEKIFNITKEISVKGADVENMYAIKCMLRDIYNSLPDEEGANG